MKLDLSVPERLAIKQALEDIIELLEEDRFCIEESEKRNRIAICNKALEKIRKSLKKDNIDKRIEE